MPLSRRELLTRSAVGAGLLAVGDLGSLFAARPAFAAGSGFAPPVVDPAGILDLPPGFSYRVVSRAGDALPGGGVTPGRHDGTGAFRRGRGGVLLVQNHEISTSDPNPTTADASLTYDARAMGGTTTLALSRDLTRVDEYVSIAGTWSNCAGGKTPWGTWLTCEETEQRADGVVADKDHGFVFEVDPHDPRHNVDPTPLLALGRFAHEAACVDPWRGHVYLTEDASGPNGLVYRCTPSDRRQRYGALRGGGRLEAMAASQDGTHVPDLSVFTVPGTTLQVRWVAVPDPLAATTSTRLQLADTEVTRSRKYEGLWWGDSGIGEGGPFGDNGRGEVHIVCSYARLSDGSLAEHDGQVWVYDPDRRTLRLEVHFPVNTDLDSDNPDGPDNITVSPHGGLILAEDGGGVQHLLAVDRDGTSSVFARNRLSGTEFTGPCFSPDGSVLFANLQDDGICLAITGPFGSA